MSFGFALEICQNHRDIATKLPDQLAASPARGRERFRVGNNGDRIKAAFAFAYGFENRDSLRADRQAIRGVLHVAASKDSAGGGVQRGSDSKIRVWRVRVFARLPRRFHK